MKKGLFLALAMLLCFSMVVSAEGFKVEGGYLFGNETIGDNTLEIKGKANGFVISGQADIVDSFGAMVNFMSVKNSDFTMNGEKIPSDVEASGNRFDLLATYKLPIENIVVKAVGGYTFGTDKENFGADEYKFNNKGFLVGATGDFAIIDKLTVSGLALFGIGVKSEDEAGEKEDLGLTTFKVSAAYEVMDNLAVEAGYLNNKLKDKGTDMKSTMSGFFFGARASF